MKRILISALALGLLFTTESCNENKKVESITKEVTFKKEGELKLMKAESDSLIATIDIEIAEGEYETQTGLMYRKSMQDNRGMLFIFENETPRSFYMKNTEFSIDIIFINADNEVVSIQKNAKPLDQTSLPSEAPAKYVLEVNAGLSDKWTLAAGDRVDWSKQ
ncbi:DUF192 domain-containing protein [Aureitalea sp. L0-47]|uniref:DUF192 domain-containing protein n=1 Tax=Aureitalea sp. L0-47 TaxID=2816962 RepID=UPI002237ACF6|nr:DUF192 domain-containing protein [Aureitalea sp. L0-47]MCW5520977.1 DUF192 domain-containing protein [Aureitalea sp. L0-47]